MARCEGSRDLEKDYHRRFAEFRLQGEWFRPASAVATGIRPRSENPHDPTSDRTALLGLELHEPLAAWTFNVVLECSGRDDADCEVMTGGAFLDLRDLKRVLDWASGIAGGVTVGKEARPMIARAYETGAMSNLLPVYSGGAHNG